MLSGKQLSKPVFRSSFLVFVTIRMAAGLRLLLLRRENLFWKPKPSPPRCKNPDFCAVVQLSFQPAP
jgi:hypothetical protein